MLKPEHNLLNPRQLTHEENTANLASDDFDIAYDELARPETGNFPLLLDEDSDEEVEIEYMEDDMMMA